jgi:hypothetical protein
VILAIRSIVLVAAALAASAWGASRPADPAPAPSPPACVGASVGAPAPVSIPAFGPERAAPSEDRPAPAGPTVDAPWPGVEAIRTSRSPVSDAPPVPLPAAEPRLATLLLRGPTLPTDAPAPGISPSAPLALRV